MSKQMDMTMLWKKSYDFYYKAKKRTLSHSLFYIFN